MVCATCAASVAEGVGFCPQCGAPQPILTAAALVGLWTGYGYTCHSDAEEPPEQIRFVQAGPIIKAVKITGDDCIRAGEPTWSGEFAVPTFPVKVHTYDLLFGTRQLEAAEARIIDADTLTVSTKRWTLTFRRNLH